MANDVNKTLLCGQKLSIILSGTLILFACNINGRHPAQAAGPLKVHPLNPRYFTDGTGKAVYLTGSHTWANFQDAGTTDPPSAFDYTAYLDFLEDHNHNFFRLWTWEQAKWTNETRQPYWIAPVPYQRTGPRTDPDGEPRFDLTKFNEAYFKRLRSRVIEAGPRGMYVAIMLFNGWSLERAKGASAFSAQNNPWAGHPFNRDNNSNGIDGDPNGDGKGDEIHTLRVPEITAMQEAYVRKVIDTVNDLDNILFEISNESPSNSQDWQYHMINYIKRYEASRPKQHPVGMTVEYPNGSNEDLFTSPADWISPNQGSETYLKNPLASNGSKVILSDTDHLCGICGNRSWVWKSFTRGMNPIFMDVYDRVAAGVAGLDFDENNENWVSVRKNLGYTRDYANRMNLAKMSPHDSLSSSGYCLANPAGTSAEYLVYLPDGGATTINLSGISGHLTVEWFNPAAGVTVPGGTTTGGATRSFTSPFGGDAVLYIWSVPTNAAT